MGFGLGLERLLLILDEEGIEIPEPVRCEVYIDQWEIGLSLKL